MGTARFQTDNWDNPILLIPPIVPCNLCEKCVDSPPRKRNRLPEAHASKWNKGENGSMWNLRLPLPYPLLRLDYRIVPSIAASQPTSTFDSWRL